MELKIEDIFQTDLASWRAGKLPDQQMALHYFLFYYHKKNPSKKLETRLLAKDIDAKILESFQFKKVKSKALNALKKWLAGEWAFHLSEKIYTPFEILQFQCHGIRPVTIKIQSELKPILHKDDCLEFFLHDLEHGHMFNFDQELKKMQLQFFNNVNQSLKTPIWDKYLARESFEEKFHYLISDMNTHLAHYKSFLFSQIDPTDQGQFEFLFSN